MTSTVWPAGISSSSFKRPEKESVGHVFAMKRSFTVCPFFSVILSGLKANRLAVISTTGTSSARTLLCRCEHALRS